MTDHGYHSLTGRPQAVGLDGAPSSPPRMSVTGKGVQNAETVDHAGAADMSMHPAQNPSVWFLVLLFGAAVLAKGARIIA